MNEYKQEIEAGKEIIRQKNVTFACFKMIVTALLKPFRGFQEEEWIDFYNSYARYCSNEFTEVEEWVDYWFGDWDTDTHSTALRKEPWQKFNPKNPPPLQKGFIVCIPREDNHITSGMWDACGNWVLLDEYRKIPKSAIVYYKPMPDLPEQLKR